MIFDNLKKDVIKAMKSGETLKRDLLRTLCGDCSKMTKEPDDAACIATIKSFLKKIDNEVLPHLEEHSTSWDKAMNEKIILESYLPKQLDEAAIRTILDPFKGKGLGVAMKHFKDNYEGQYDGKLVSTLAREIV